MKAATLRFVLVATLAPLLGGYPGAQEGGIEVFAAGTLFSGGTRIAHSSITKEKSALYRGSDEISDPLGRSFTERRTVLSVDHGLRPDLTLSALVPVVYKDLDSNAGDVHSFGLGDVAVLAKFRAYKKDWRRGTVNVSAIGGLELPTGRTTATSSGSRLSPGLQPGLGAWNPFVGLASNLNLNRLRVDVLAFFKDNTEGAQDFEKGDFFAFEVDAAYRFFHTKYPGPTASAKLGLQWRHEDRAEQAGLRVVNSGAEELRARSGLTWHPQPQFDLTLALDVPLYQELGGDQLGLDYRASLSVGLRF